MTRALRRQDPDDFLDGAITTARPRTRPGLTSFDRFQQAYATQSYEKWESKLLPALFKLSRLPVGWDGYSGQPMRMDTGFFALQVLEAVMRSRTPLPQIVPTPVGGVQFEWHERGIDLELHVTGPYECEIWFEDKNGRLPPI